jgi:Lar family restriction alleviation protein
MTLKPCPFCGGRARILEWCIHQEAFAPFYVVDCGKCGNGTSKTVDKEKAIKLWNRRKK